MPLQPIATKRIYLQIADQIATAIREGEYLPGTSLPPERVLATQFRVSRVCVREALVALQLMGLVDVRPGDGAFVLEARPGGISTDQLHHEISAFDLMRAREIIEPAVAGMAAEMASDDDLKQFHEAIAIMERENAEGSPEEEGDRHFHELLATTTRNGVLEILMHQLWDLRRDHEWDTLNRRALTPEHREAYLDDHRRILTCIAQKDAAGARREMLRHLKSVEDHFLTP